MFRSLYKRPSKSVLLFIQIDNVKFFSSSENEELVKRIYFERKKLYGGVINKDYAKVKSDSTYLPIANDIQDAYVPIVSPPDTSNEFYWMVKRQKFAKNVKTFKIFRKNEIDQAKNNGSNSSNETSELDLISKVEQNKISSRNSSESHNTDYITAKPISSRNVILSAKNLLDEFIISNRANAQLNNSEPSIPFSENELKSIIKYPMLCEKATMAQTEDILTNKSIYLPSISKILQATMPEPARIALKKWKLAKIAELGAEGFRQFEKETLETGKQFHLAVQNYLTDGQVPNCDSPIINLWQSLDDSIKALNPKPLMIEKPIVHAELKYKGIVDNVSLIK